MLVNINSKVKLNNGVAIPYIGFGTYNIVNQKDIKNAIHAAFEAGYRHIDTARMYNNEIEIGNVLKESSIPREEIFITSKLWSNDHGYNESISAVEKSLKNLDLDYIDLYLIHWPNGGKLQETWDGLIDCLKNKKCRAIGVSNFTIHHLKALNNNSSIIPAVNQVEFNPFHYQKDLLEFCRSKDIQLEAYSPLNRGEKLKNNILKEIAEKYSKTEAQIMLRWSLQQEVVVIPKSIHKERIINNADIFNFVIEPDDIKKLNLLG